MDVSFVEVGTSDFNTCLERATPDEIGFSIEPIKEYLDRLPDKPNVTKVNAAISVDGQDGECDIWYIPPKVIEENNMRYHWKGCNAVDKIHPEAGRFKHLYVKETVPKITIGRFLTENNIEGIKLLQIDVEGWDCHIMDQLHHYLVGKNDTKYYPEIIIFEFKHSESKHVEKVINKFVDLGYMYDGKIGGDATLRFPQWQSPQEPTS